MKKRLNGFIPGFVTALLLVGLVGTAAATVGKRSIEVDYKNLVVEFDYSTIDLTDVNGNPVEPFAYNGTTYVPVRAIATALGYDVSYREINGTGYIGLEPPVPKFCALTKDYPFTGVPRLDGIVGNNAFQMSFPVEEGNTERTHYEYYKRSFNDGTEDSYVSLYDTVLKDAGFKLFQTSTVDGSPMYHYVNDDTKVFVSFTEHKIGNVEYVSVLVNTEQQKKSTPDTSKPSTSSGSSSSSSSSSSTSPSAPPVTPDDPYADNDYVVDVPDFDGDCPHCGLACIRDRDINGTLAVWYCRNPKCNYYMEKFQA